MKDLKEKGWVRLYRKIENNPLYFLEPFTKAQAWIDLFLNANHKSGIIEIRGNIIKIKRGQIGWSELTMAKRWSWSKNKVRRYLKWLETEQQITQQKDRFITTIITILKYDEYQEDTKTIQQTIQQKDSRRYINKNVKNVKNNISKDILVQLSKIFDFPLRENKTAYSDINKLLKRFKTKEALFAFAEKANSFEEYPYAIESPGALYRKADKIEARLKKQKDIEKDKMFYEGQEVKEINGKLKVITNKGEYFDFGGETKDIVNYNK